MSDVPNLFGYVAPPCGNSVGTDGPQAKKSEPDAAAVPSERPYHSEGSPVGYWETIRWDRDRALEAALGAVEAGEDVEAVRDRLEREFSDALFAYRRDDAGRAAHGYYRESKRLHFVAQKTLRAFNREHPSDRFTPEGYYASGVAGR